MSNSKKDFEIISKIFINIVSNLSNEQYSNLISGNAELQYVEKNVDGELKEYYEKIIQEITLLASNEEKINLIDSSLSKKIDMVNFCKYYQIPYKTKDNNQQLVQNILDYINLNKDEIKYKFEKKQNIEEEIDNLAIELQKIMDVEEAKEILKNSDIIQHKSDLLKFARKLNVFVDRGSSFDSIIDSIIKSVVESKIRSYTIRNKI